MYVKRSRSAIFSLVVSFFVVIPLLADEPSPPTSGSAKDLHYFIIDRSGSIGTKKLVDPFHKAIVDFVGRLDTETQVEIVFFSDKATTPRSWYPMDLRAKGDFDTFFVKNCTPGGQTRLYDTVAEVLSRVKASEKKFRRITVVILSDGEDNQSKVHKNWGSLEKIIPEDWAKKRKGFSVIWETVGFEPGPESKPSPDSFVKQVTVHDLKKIGQMFIPAPKASFTGNPAKVKVNSPVLFALDDDTGVTKVEWSFGDKMTSPKKTAIHRYSAKGIYDIAVTVEGPGGKATLERKGYVQVLEEVALEAQFSWHPLMIHVGEKIKFSDESLGAPDSWTWGFPNAGAQETRNPTTTFTKPGTKTVMLTVEKEGRKHSVKHELDVLPLPPEPSFSATPAVLEIGQVLHLKATRTETDWTHKWTIGGDIQMEGPETEWKADKLGRVEILHSVSGRGGLVDRGFVVFIKEKPEKLVSRFRWAPTEIHAGDQVQFVDESAGSPESWIWEISGVGTLTEHNPSVTFSRTGKSIVKLVIERDGRRASSQQDLQVLHPVLNLQAFFEVSEAKGRAPLTVHFKDTSKGEISSWRWEFGDGETSDVQNPRHTYRDAKSYNPRLTITNSQGEEAIDAGDATITVTPPPPLWLKILIGVIILLLLWVLVIVPFLLRPLLAPQKGVAFRGTTVSFLRSLARRKSNVLWPCRTVTIGSGKRGDIKVGGIGQKNGLLARVSRIAATSNYELVAHEANAVASVRQQVAPDGKETTQLVPLVPGQPRTLRDGEQYDVRGTILTWVQPNKKKR